MITPAEHRSEALKQKNLRSTPDAAAMKGVAPGAAHHDARSGL